jgi:hypothetical protein
MDQQIRQAGGGYEKPDPNNDPVGSYRSNGQKAFDELRSFLQERYWNAPDLTGSE